MLWHPSLWSHDPVVLLTALVALVFCAFQKEEVAAGTRGSDCALGYGIWNGPLRHVQSLDPIPNSVANASQTTG